MRFRKTPKILNAHTLMSEDTLKRKRFLYLNVRRASSWIKVRMLFKSSVLPI